MFTTTSPPGHLRLEAASGLSGRVIEFRQIDLNRREVAGAAIIERDAYPFPDRPYSVAYLDTSPSGAIVASLGEYDLDLAAARDELDRRTSRGKYAIA